MIRKNKLDHYGLFFFGDRKVVSNDWAVSIEHKAGKLIELPVLECLSYL